MKSTDWDATLSSIEDAVAKESYLVWLKEQEERYQLKEKGEVITTNVYNLHFTLLLCSVHLLVSVVAVTPPPACSQLHTKFILALIKRRVHHK